MCRRVGAETFPNAKVKETVAKFEPVRIDFNTEQALCEKYGVRAMPDFRILKSDGAEVHQIKRGFLPPEELVRELESALAKAK